MIRVKSQGTQPPVSNCAAIEILRAKLKKQQDDACGLVPPSAVGKQAVPSGVTKNPGDHQWAHCCYPGHGHGRYKVHALIQPHVMPPRERPGEA